MGQGKLTQNRHREAYPRDLRVARSRCHHQRSRVLGIAHIHVELGRTGRKTRGRRFASTQRSQHGLVLGPKAVQADRVLDDRAHAVKQQHAMRHTVRNRQQTNRLTAPGAGPPFCSSVFLSTLARLRSSMLTLISPRTCFMPLRSS